MASLNLDRFPEELIERILSLALPSPADPRPLWLRSPTRLALVQTSRQLTRIVTPLLYRSIHIPTPVEAGLLLRTLRERPSLATHIRCLSLAGIWRDAAEIISLCSDALCMLDLTISFDADNDCETDGLYAEALCRLTSVRHLTLRKPNTIYLSLPRPRAIINALARAIPHWQNLHTAHIAFKLSDDTPTSPVTAPSTAFSPFALTPSQNRSPATPHGPITLLTNALAAAPALHTFTTHLPSVWNVAILAVASNPALHRIVLLDARAAHHIKTGPPHGGVAIVGTGLFLMEARRHARLAELIRAGTPVIRGRAHTMGTPSPSPSPPGGSSPSTSAVVAPGVAGLQKRESGVGLGLRIDTAVGGSRGGTGSGSASAVAGVHPSWVGSPHTAQGNAKGKGKRRRH